MKNGFKFAMFGLVLVAFTPFIAKSDNKPIYAYKGEVQNMIETMREERVGLNKFGEFLYSAKDSFFISIEDSFLNMLMFISASTKVLGIGKETNTKILSDLYDTRHNTYFDKALTDLRFGVESDAFSNKIAIALFCPIGSVMFGGGILHKIENMTKSVKENETIYNLYK